MAEEKKMMVGSLHHQMTTVKDMDEAVHLYSDVLGLTRAWIYAGTPSVLASLWKVDDRATSRLMTAFYENLKTHDKAKALQLAQIDMIREGLGPFYWAAFCLYGDYQ